MRTTLFGIDATPFGKSNSGELVTLYRLTNSHGNSISMMDLGAILVSIDVPDRNGIRTNINAGFPTIDGYLQRHPYFGSTVGRFCNRIANGKFSIDGKSYALFVNNGPNHLHGGKIGFDQLLWSTERLLCENSVGLRFSLTSPDGQEGYPGTLHVTADYVWDNENTLSIRFQASTDQATHVNLTNHAYFNLGGFTNLEGLQGGTVYDHSLSVESIEYVPVDANMIPTGNTASVVGTPLDFTKPTDIGDRIHQLEQTRGYDHCFVVNGPAGTLRPAATVYHPGSGRTMVVRTTQPGVQLYTGNFLDGTWASGGFKQHEAFCLETQHYPDSPNQRTFPTTLLKPGEKLDETTTFEFGTRA